MERMRTREREGERVSRGRPDASSMFSQNIPSFFLFIFSSVLSYFLSIFQ